MEYCKAHLNRAKKGRGIGTAVLLVLGGLFAAFWLLLTLALTTAEDATAAIFLLAAVIFLLPGGAMLFFGIRRLRRGPAGGPEDSRLARSIRRQLPAAQAALPAAELFAIVDRDLQGGRAYGADVALGREWALVGDLALRLAGIRGIFLLARASRTPHTYVSSYQIRVYNDAREAGEAVFLLDRDTALACLKALGAAAPWAAHGGMEEEVKFLAIPPEEFRRWSEGLARQQAEKG